MWHLPVSLVYLREHGVVLSMSMRVNIGPLAVQLRNGLVSLAMLLLAACASAAEAEAPDPPSYVTEARVPWADLPHRLHKLG